MTEGSEDKRDLVVLAPRLHLRVSRSVLVTVVVVIVAAGYLLVVVSAPFGIYGYDVSASTARWSAAIVMPVACLAIGWGIVRSARSDSSADPPRSDEDAT
jgi:hypothetical protein